METLPVTIIVKAPNQQFEDQTVKCESTWSIRKLKGYLSEVYPCNPSLDEQKLIYSGQLLNDSHILKDVLRQYEGQETHTVHLVYTPKNRYQQSTTSKPTQNTNKNPNDSERTRQQPVQSQQQQQQPQRTENAFGTDGLRQRNVGSNAQQNFQQPNIPPFMTGFLNTPQPFMPSMSFAPIPQNGSNQQQPQYTPEQYAIAQQMAMQNMMHQMYLQYLNQYANAMQSNGVMDSRIPNYFAQPNITSGQQQDSDSPSSNSASNATQQQQQAAPANPPPAPRFQADDDAENRDWLEILYTLSRLIVLLSLVYFYSSPGRCSIVILVMVLYYFYQNHQRNLRDRQQVERLQAAVAREEPDVIDAPVENNEQPPNENENVEVNRANVNEAPVSASDTAASSSSSSSTSGEQDENNRLPTVTLLRTFILSFFSSLIPETPAV